MTTETKGRKKAKKLDKAIVAKHYQHHLLTEGKAPKSVYAFCQELEIEEAVFYEHFSSLQAIETYCWKALFQETVEIVEGDPAFAEYNARERYLAFQFVQVQELRKNLSYFRMVVADKPKWQDLDQFRKAMKPAKVLVERILQEGRATGEIAERAFLDKLVDRVFMAHVGVMLRFALHDQSDGFTKTDQAIEKSVNFLFDSLAKGPLDSGLELMKFMGQQRFS